MGLRKKDKKNNKYRTVDIGAWLKILHSFKYINYNNDHDPHSSLNHTVTIKKELQQSIPKKILGSTVLHLMTFCFTIYYQVVL